MQYKHIYIYVYVSIPPLFIPLRLIVAFQTDPNTIGATWHRLHYILSLFLGCIQVRPKRTGWLTTHQRITTYQRIGYRHIPIRFPPSGAGPINLIVTFQTDSNTIGVQETRVMEGPKRRTMLALWRTNLWVQHISLYASLPRALFPSIGDVITRRTTWPCGVTVHTIRPTTRESIDVSTTGDHYR